MSPITTAERAEMRAMARELARRELTPRAAALDAGGKDVLSECWGRLVEAGLDRALLSEQNGGVELSVLDLLATIEELAVGDGGIAMCVLLCNAALATLADEQLAEVPWGARWALVPAAPEVELTVSGGALDGRLACALGAHDAHGLLFLLDGPAPLTWAVDGSAAGLKLERDLAQMGLRGAPAASIELTGVACLCPSGCARGADGSDGPTTAMSAASARALLRAGTAAIAHGIARRAYEMALEYADPTGLAVDGARSLAVNIAATDAAVASTTDAVQVFGGTGYMVETGIEKLMRDAKYCQLFPECNWVAHDELMRPERAR
jgi:alkylation response protein AidB-like acyl-CoA dehydrogenase